MQRIGTLMDSALNNRQSSNPFENARKITTRDIYPPTGILVKKGIQSIKIVWDAPPSNALLRYEVTFDNLTTGERTVKSSFTNQVIFKASKGTYIARIVSISRNRSTSLVRTVQFSAGDEVMQLEGAKHGPLELGTLIQDDILQLAGYSIYVWGSVVLDKYVLANQTNTPIIFRLWKSEGPDAEFNDTESPPTLIETIEMYPATESASNLDDLSRGGLISRPDPSTGRVGSFETSQSIMFSPIPVPSAEADTTFTYFLQAINREVDADEVNLSITMWTGSDGQGDNVPGDPFTPAPAYVFPNQNCFHTQIVGYTDASKNPALDTRSMWASVPQSLNLIANQHSIAIWFRPDDINGSDMAAGRTETTIGTLNLFSRIAIRPPSGSGAASNSWDIRVVGLSIGGGHAHELQVRYRDKTGTDTRLIRFRGVGNNTGTNNDISSGLFSVGGAPTATNAQNDAWYLLVLCFEGGDFTSDDPTKLRAYMNSATNPVGGNAAMVKLTIVGVDTFEQALEQDDTDTMAYSIGDSSVDGLGNIVHNVSDGLFMGGLRTPNSQCDIQVHQLGLWNIALDRNRNAGSDSGLGGLEDIGLVNGFVNSSSIDHLFNGGFGTTVDWKSGYNQSQNLIHLIQFGAVEQAMSTGLPGRDTGYHYFNGDMNFTGVTPEGRYLARFNFTDDPDSSNPPTADNTGNHYTDNTTIADILSPDGANGTTEFDKCFPGQNL